MGTGAVSRYKHERSQESVKVQRFYWGVAAGVRVVRYEGHNIESREFKNRDKQMTFIVRVSVCFLNLLLSVYCPCGLDQSSRIHNCLGRLLRIPQL